MNLDASASMVIEPYDWYLTAQSIYNHPEEWTSYVGMAPFVPNALGRLIRAADDVPTSIVKEAAELAAKGPTFTKKMLSESEVIASGSAIRKIGDLVDKFGGTKKGWTKKKGWDDCGQEWHWYEHHGIGRVGAKPSGTPDPF